MKFASAYEPGEFETEIYSAWEKAGVFLPKRPEKQGGAAKDGGEREVGRENASGAERENASEAERKYYSIVMPPPNANGNLHIGHGLTIALEDSLTRYHRLRGESTWYVPGADHAGFETWVVYERFLESQGHTRFEYSREELYAQVWKFVQEQRGNMELQVRALGASCSWGDLTFTLDENVVRRVYATFERMWKEGMIYRGEKLVNYCPKHQTAFADIEVEHEEMKGHLWEIAYEVVDSGPSASSADALLPRGTQSAARSGAPVSSHLDRSEQLQEIIVATTRPETLFGDTAVAVNPEDERYRGLIGKSVRLPLTNREIPVVADEHADPEYGTGAVKITPAHDYDDFEVGLRHDLPRVRVIDDQGRMMNCGAEYDGLTTEECRKKVLKDLKEQGLLRGEKEITHTVARCYKCGAVIEPTLKEQWFIDVKRLAREAIKHLERDEIRFFPASKKQVLINYLEGLKDWNISRQIPWGIAIPMFRRVDSEGTTPRVEEAPEWIFDTRTNLAEIEVGGVKYVRDEDTFDTWFSSSHWPIVCTNWEEGDSPRKQSSASSADALLSRRTTSASPSGAPASSHLTTSGTNLDLNSYYPLNVMETGADILFAWVARMIMMGIYVTGEVPFREVYLHGLVLDAHGQKMSKSKGNVVNPMELVAKYGSDAFRLGILRGRSAGMNQAFSENAVVAGRNLCNKLWNVSRLVQAIVDDEVAIDNDTSASSADALLPRGTQSAARSGAPASLHLDRSEQPLAYTTENMGEDWICREINAAREAVEEQMRTYRFAEAVETLYSLVWDKYADWFIESQKLYHNVNLLEVTLEAILKMLHPFAPFVTEAIWQNLSWTEGMLIAESWPEDFEFDPVAAEQFANLTEVISEVRSSVVTISKLPGAAKLIRRGGVDKEALDAGDTSAEKGGLALLYGDDSLVADNDLLVRALAKVAAVESCEGQPRGIRLALANHELYLDVPAPVVELYAEALDERILAVGRELDALNARMMNPRYVDKAPVALVEETRRGIEEKSSLIERLKREREAI